MKNKKAQWAELKNIIIIIAVVVILLGIVILAFKPTLFSNLGNLPFS